jgi:hypothetical protein
MLLVLGKNEVSDSSIFSHFPPSRFITIFVFPYKYEASSCIMIWPQ